MTIQEKFEQFDEQNPDVYEELVALARQGKAAGRTRLSVEELYVVLRWQRSLHTVDDHSNFKLNDHYTSRYARLIMENEPDLDGMFETRTIRSE